MKVQHFDRNNSGRDFIVGDIHGCFKLLWDALSKIGFDEKADRLFSVGDLIDRGPESKDVEQWLDLPWFHAVMGNHEKMAINFANGHNHAYHYERNGGRWFIDLDNDDQQRIAKRFEELPLAIEVEAPNGTFGIIHAEVPHDDWKGLWLYESKEHEHIALWERDRIDTGRQNLVAGIDRVYVGHTVVEHAVRLGNVSYIDTGVVHGGALTIKDITNDVLYVINREEHANQT